MNEETAVMHPSVFNKKMIDEVATLQNTNTRNPKSFSVFVLGKSVILIGE